MWQYYWCKWYHLFLRWTCKTCKDNVKGLDADTCFSDPESAVMSSDHDSRLNLLDIANITDSMMLKEHKKCQK